MIDYQFNILHGLFQEMLVHEQFVFFSSPSTFHTKVAEHFDKLSMTPVEVVFLPFREGTEGCVKYPKA